MDAFNKFVDYFMDFHKVRKFQEMCGLAEVKNEGITSMDVNKIATEKLNRCSSDSLRERHDHSSKTNSSSKCHIDEEPLKKNSVNYTVNNKILHYLFLAGSMLGTEVFYITALPVIFWNLDVSIARMVITVWVVTMYLGQAAKDLLRWPRPTWPPVFKLETRVEAEYGLPSTHAIAATAVPFTMLFAAMGRYNINFPLGLFLASCWCLLVSLSRLYVGMHSILDVMAGIALTAVYLYFGWPFMEMVNDYTMYSQYAPFIIIVSHFLLAIFYPNSDHWSTTRGDTVIILGVGAGVHCASWLGNYYGFNWEPAGEPPYDITFPTIHNFGIGFARYLIGVTTLIVIRAAMKYLSLLVLCHAVSVPKDDELSRRRTEIEVPYKFITYTCVGLGANFFVLVMLQYLGIVV